MFSKISKAQIKHIRLLHLKKYRQKYNQFIVEGIKSVNEFVNSNIKCIAVYAENEHLLSFKQQIGAGLCYETKAKELQQISAFKNSQEVLAVFEIPQNMTIDKNANFILALDDIRDPGNLGTIIRTAEWFGLKEIVCSLTSAECYNPKVIQASMGSVSRMKIHYVDLEQFLIENKTHQIVLADMVGKDYQEFEWNKNILVIGNEANGISAYLKAMPNEKITIPRRGAAESLNAAISTAIILASVKM